MTINFLEKSAMMFFKFCKMHPELCPHDFEWYLSGQRNENGKLYNVKYYKCPFCGKEEIIKEKV